MQFPPSTPPLPPPAAVEEAAPATAPPPEQADVPAAQASGCTPSPPAILQHFVAFLGKQATPDTPPFPGRSLVPYEARAPRASSPRSRCAVLSDFELRTLLEPAQATPSGDLSAARSESLLWRTPQWHAGQGDSPADYSPIAPAPLYPTPVRPAAAAAIESAVMPTPVPRSRMAAACVQTTPGLAAAVRTHERGVEDATCTDAVTPLGVRMARTDPQSPPCPHLRTSHVGQPGFLACDYDETCLLLLAGTHSNCCRAGYVQALPAVPGFLLVSGRACCTPDRPSGRARCAARLHRG